VIQTSTDDQVRARVNAYIKGGGLRSDDLPTDKIIVKRAEALAGTSDKASVIQINYPFNFIVLNPVVKLIAPSSTTGEAIEMSSSAIMRNEM
jgi:hypothetical protein